MKVVALFGSNSGNKYRLITEAIYRLSSEGKIISLSSFYETEPWGFECDENFLNRVVVYDTLLSPADFLKQCLQVEQQLGRQRISQAARYTSRPIDIDILFYEHLILNTPELTIPHPRLAERNFALVPLVELMPDFIHPVFQKTLTTLQLECPDRLQVVRISDENTLQ